MEECSKSQTVKIVGIVVIGIVMLTAIFQQLIIPAERNVSVVGQGRVAIIPDIAVLDLSVSSIKAATAEEALNQTTKKMQDVQNSLDSLGIPVEDRQLTAYAFNPVFESVEGGDGSKIVGYDGLQKITVKVRGIDNNKRAIDQLIQKVVRDGVDQVGNVSFVYSDIEKAKQQAREKAIVDAKTKAQSMQSIAGIKIGKITDLTESAVAVPGQSYTEGNVSYNYNSSSFNNENSPYSSNYQNGPTEVIMEVTIHYSVR